ncbi:hypothetical protein, partial [Pandoraea pneumonica]|uniref:hypothetical protein n=1 Tax=Pandoraea pneumonica TaxID=2508299 RepID=UPI003CE7348F
MIRRPPRSPPEVTLVPDTPLFRSRVGDLAWAAGEYLTPRNILRHKSGPTTHRGEGLQHEDGHSHVRSGVCPGW